MNPIKEAIAYLNRPFPEQESQLGVLKTTALLSGFVVFFLFVFEPFGIADMEDGKLWICLGFGAMTFLGAVLFEFLVSNVLGLKGELEQWTFGKWILYNIGIILTISLANFLFVRLAFFGYVDWSLLPHMIYGTFMVGLVPILILGSLSLLFRERKYRELATGVERSSPVDPPRVEKYFVCGVPLSRVRYVRGLQNYVTIGYLDEDGNFLKLTERATLKNILNETSGSSLVRSHRSFLVNRDVILSASGNAQGLLLEVADCDRTVPVSRSYVDVFREG